MIPIGTNVERNSLPKATLALIAINVIVFIFELAMPVDALVTVFNNFGFSPVTRNPLAAVTSIFLHADIFHVAFNMLFLWVFGSPVEERVGSRNFLIYYFGAGVVSGLLHVIMEVIARPDSTSPLIGASGAISGIMALFLYRCFYSKMRLVISPILLPRQINIPVVPLILFWFFKDVIGGIFSMTHQVGIAYWAHVGGFIFGIAIGKIKKYGHEGQVEWIRERILKKLEGGGGWKAAEKDLLKLIKIAPEDPEVQHDLARLYAGNSKPKLAEKHYAAAVQQYFLKDPESAAYTVLEYAETMSRSMDIQYMFKAADALVKTNEFEDAHKVLLPVLGREDNSGPLVERSLVLFIKICRQLDKTGDVNEGLKIFNKHFPESRYENDVRTIMQTAPGDVFLHNEQVRKVISPGRENRDERDAEGMGRIAFFERVFADPAFWSIMLFTNIAAPILFPGLYRSQLVYVLLFAVSFGMTVIHRMGSVTDILFSSRVSEKQARQEVNTQRDYDNAVSAQDSARYPEAAALYERVLAVDPRNIQARFNLARIYDRQLDIAVKARVHCRALMKLIPPEHPYYRDAVDMLKKNAREKDLLSPAVKT